jgi:3-hydroxy-9,10-secoandrosta-1,3,5(10)-triene-9,17-dione monooxygenase reductase component
VTIHSDHPFLPPPDARDRIRQLRGRLAGPVTIVTAGADGMTASAVLVIEGDPPRVAVAISRVADFHDAVQETERFVIHVAAQQHRHLSDRFAELAPSPGGLFAGLTVIDTDWGPRIEGFDTWAGCRLEKTVEIGYQTLVVGLIDHLEVSDFEDPLVYFRGRYRRLA